MIYFLGVSCPNKFLQTFSSPPAQVYWRRIPKVAQIPT